MACTDSTQDLFRQRLLAVMDYDGIAQSKRVAHLASSCGTSVSTARRMLSGKYDIGGAKAERMFDIAYGFNIHWRWIHDGKFHSFEPRTARIQLVMFEGCSPEQADMYISSIARDVAGEPFYVSLSEASDLATIFCVEQHRRMTPWEQNKNIRFILRLNNNNPKAQRLLDMCMRGQISKHQLLTMM